MMFYTSGELPISHAQKAALLNFVRSGRGFLGVHSATDTFYTWPDYLDLVGGYFNGHPWHQAVTIEVVDPGDPLVAFLGNSLQVEDETGPLRGLQKPYLVAVHWDYTREEKPYVILREPRLYPRQGATFDQIPHLIFNSEQPELSGLCLFDPEGKEWSNKLLIADTTIPWAAEWLGYYELWHLEGVWRGSGVGPE